MNRRARTAHRSSPFLKFLKPGALAQIRDSRISSSRSHRINWISQIRSTPPMSPSAADAGLPQVTVAADGFPCFSVRIYGPRCPQRKKLVAGKSVFLRPPPSPVPDSPDPIIDLFSSDILTAH